MSNPPTDNGIPMLTEVFTPESPPAPAKPVAAPAASPANTAHAAPVSPNPFSVLPKAADPRPQPSVPASTTQPMPQPAAPATSAPLPPSSILKPQATPQPAIAHPPADMAKPAAPAVVPAAVAAPKPAAPAIAPEPDWPEITTLSAIPSDEWQRLENDIRQRISRQVLERIDFVLDHRLRSSIATVVDQAMDGLATEIKRGLHETLEETVSRAVTQEIARLNPLKK